MSDMSLTYCLVGKHSILEGLLFRHLIEAANAASFPPYTSIQKFFLIWTDPVGPCGISCRAVATKRFLSECNHTPTTFVSSET
jgi:hypothetical protein